MSQSGEFSWSNWNNPANAIPSRFKTLGHNVSSPFELPHGQYIAFSTPPLSQINVTERHAHLLWIIFYWEQGFTPEESKILAKQICSSEYGRMGALPRFDFHRHSGLKRRIPNNITRTFGETHVEELHDE